MIQMVTGQAAGARGHTQATRCSWPWPSAGPGLVPGSPSWGRGPRQSLCGLPFLSELLLCAWEVRVHCQISLLSIFLTVFLHLLIKDFREIQKGNPSRP